MTPKEAIGNFRNLVDHAIGKGILQNADQVLGLMESIKTLTQIAVDHEQRLQGASQPSPGDKK